MNDLKGLSIILNFVANKEEVSIDDIKSNSRLGRYVNARHLYFWLARKYTKYSLSEISKMVNRDHASCLHGVNKFDKWREVDRGFDVYIGSIVDIFRREAYPELKKVRALNSYEKHRKRMETKYMRENANRIYYEDKIAKLYAIAATAIKQNTEQVEKDTIMEGYVKAAILERNKKASKELFDLKMSL